MAAPISLYRDPAFSTEPLSSPLLAVAGHAHLLGDDIRDSAASPTSPAPDPAANCGMPDRPLVPSGSPPLAEATPGVGPAPLSSHGEGPGERTLPLADRCWDLFCQGHSYAAIGRTLGIHRETAARHVRAIHQQVQADRRADRALALSRALAAQERIQATAWDLLALAQARLLPAGAPLPAPLPPLPSQGRGRGLGGSGERSATFADCARLLNIILASARETARLDLLYDRDAPARAADQDPKEKTVHLIIERLGDAYVDPTSPGAPAPPPAPASTPPTPSQPSPSHSDSEDGTGHSADHSGPDSACSPPRCGEDSEDRPVSPITLLAHPERAAEQASAKPPTSSAPSASSVVNARLSPPRARGGAGGEAPHPRLRRIWLGLPVAAGYPLG